MGRPSRCDLQRARSQAGPRASPRGRARVPAGRADLERNDGRDGPLCPPPHHHPAPVVNEARPFFQEPPLGDSRARLPPLALAAAGEVWLWALNCICFPAQGPLTLSLEPWTVARQPLVLGTAQQLRLPVLCCPLPPPVPQALPPSLPQQPGRQNNKNTKRSFTALSCFLPKRRE